HPGRKKSPLEHATTVSGKGERPAKAGAAEKKSPHDSETGAQRSERLKKAWDKIGSISRQVQQFETEYARGQRKIAEMLEKGQGNAASIELMGLGSRCDEISRHVAEAKTLARGNEGYEKEVKFYEEWHKQTRAKLHAAIVDTKGLGGQVAISGFGISESTHPDIFENTRQIYAVRTKVESFGGALHDSDAHEHVQRL